MSMPVGIALLALALFVAFTLPWFVVRFVVGVIGVEQRATVVIVAIMLCASEISFRSNTSASVSIDGQTIGKAAIFAAAALLCLGIRHRHPRPGAPSSLALLAFVAWAVLTSVSSGYRLTSVCSSLLLASAVFFGVTIARRSPPRTWQFGLLAGSVSFLVIGLVASVFSPAQTEIEQTFGSVDVTRYGGLGGPNVTGRVAALCLVLAVGLYLQERRALVVFGLCACLAALVLVRTESRTSEVVALVAISFLLWRRFGWRLVPLVALPAVVITWAAGGLASASLMQAASRSGDAQEVTNLSGRTTIWQTGLHLFKQKPLTGHGYGTARSLLAQSQASDLVQKVSTFHSDLINVLVTVGLVGALLLGGVYVAVARKAWSSSNAIAGALFLVLLFAGLTEANTFNTLPASTTLVLALLVGMPRALSRDPASPVAGDDSADVEVGVRSPDLTSMTRSEARGA